MLWFASEFQVQIYNQYGQFVRKFGANILQHPRGVCVDNKGRIIVVECKVMRVIIFDQVRVKPYLFSVSSGAKLILNLQTKVHWSFF